MKILSFTASAASKYCGSCLRDNTLAAELGRQGHDITLLPLHTPTLTAETNLSEAHGGAGAVLAGLTRFEPAQPSSSRRMFSRYCRPVRMRVPQRSSTS